MTKEQVTNWCLKHGFQMDSKGALGRAKGQELEIVEFTEEGIIYTRCFRLRSLKYSCALEECYLTTGSEDECNTDLILDVKRVTGK
jgi:hypothetical protein